MRVPGVDNYRQPVDRLRAFHDWLAGLVGRYPEHLRAYVPLFHPRLIGLTGDAASIHKAAEAYRVYYAKVPLKGDDYTVDHSAFIYLIGRNGEYIGFFPPGTSAELLVGTLRPLIANR